MSSQLNFKNTNSIEYNSNPDFLLYQNLRKKLQRQDDLFRNQSQNYEQLNFSWKQQNFNKQESDFSIDVPNLSTPKHKKIAWPEPDLVPKSFSKIYPPSPPISTKPPPVTSSIPLKSKVSSPRKIQKNSVSSQFQLNYTKPTVSSVQKTHIPPSFSSNTENLSNNLNPDLNNELIYNNNIDTQSNHLNFSKSTFPIQNKKNKSTFTRTKNTELPYSSNSTQKSKSWVSFIPSGQSFDKNLDKIPKNFSFLNDQKGKAHSTKLKSFIEADKKMLKKNKSVYNTSKSASSSQALFKPRPHKHAIHLNNLQKNKNPSIQKKITSSPSPSTFSKLSTTASQNKSSSPQSISIPPTNSSHATTISFDDIMPQIKQMISNTLQNELSSYRTLMENELNKSRHLQQKWTEHQQSITDQQKQQNHHQPNITLPKPQPHHSPLLKSSDSPISHIHTPPKPISSLSNRLNQTILNNANHFSYSIIDDILMEIVQELNCIETQKQQHQQYDNLISDITKSQKKLLFLSSHPQLTDKPLLSPSSSSHISSITQSYSNFHLPNSYNLSQLAEITQYRNNYQRYYLQYQKELQDEVGLTYDQLGQILTEKLMDECLEDISKEVGEYCDDYIDMMIKNELEPNPSLNNR